MKRNEELQKKLDLALEMDRKIVGVRLLKTAEDFQHSKAQAIRSRLPYCMMVGGASKGNLMKGTGENMGCSGASLALGFLKATPEFYCGQQYYDMGTYKNVDIAKKTSDKISMIEEDKYGVEVGALELMEETPDVVIMVVNPFNAMRIIQGYSYSYGTNDAFKMAGMQAICAESTSYPYVSQKINVSLLCAGTRMLNQWGTDELAISMPFTLLEKTIEGVLKTINPLERDGNKKVIAAKADKIQPEALQLEEPIVYGQNYDTGFYFVGEKGKI